MICCAKSIRPELFYRVYHHKKTGVGLICPGFCIMMLMWLLSRQRIIFPFRPTDPLSDLTHEFFREA